MSGFATNQGSRACRDKRLPVIFFVALLLLLLPLKAPSALAVTNGTGDGTYDFGGLGSADSAAAGYASLGDKFRVPNGMYAASPTLGGATGDNTALYLASGGTATAVIEAAGNSTCRSFTFRDLGVSAYQAEDTFSSFRLVLKSYFGDVLYDHTFGTSATIPYTSIVQLSSLYSVGTWNVAGVSRIELSYTLTSHARDVLNFENMTVANVSSKYPSAQTPVITTQPSDKTVNVGQGAVLTVSAGGVSAGTLSYQWYSNTADANSGGNLISGATGTTYSAPTGAVGTMYYYCVVTNTDPNAVNSSSVSSRAAKVVVNNLVNAQAPSITAQPQSVTVATGTPASLSVTASVATGTLSYQWYSNTTDSNSSGSQILGANLATYSVTPSSVGKVYYYCVVTNTDTSATGSQTASTASQTASVTATYGSGAYDFSGLGTAGSAEGGYTVLGSLFKVPDGLFSATPSMADPTGSLKALYFAVADTPTAVFKVIGNDSYRSFTFRDLGVSLYQIAGNFTSLRLVLKDNLGNTLADESLGASGAIPDDSIAQLSTLFSRGAWNVAGVSTIEITYSLSGIQNFNLNFENITLGGTSSKYLNAATPVITASPFDTTVNAGQEASLTVAVGSVSEGTLSYQWYSNATRSNTGGSLIPGATGSAYSAPTADQGTNYYYCVVTNTDTDAINSVKSTPSAAAKVTVNELVNAQAPVISAQPQNTSVPAGSPASVSVTASVTTGTLSYQWYSNTVDSNAGGDLISGAHLTAYNVTPSSVGKTYYYCVVTNTDTSATGSQTASTTSQAAAVTATYASGTYDFSGLGVTSSAGIGYTAIGALFRAPNGMYAAAASLNSTVPGAPKTALYPTDKNITTAVLEASGGENCQSFTFKDLGLSAYQTADSFTSLRLVLKNSAGDTLSDETLGASGTIPKDSIVQLTVFSCGMERGWRQQDRDHL